MFLNGLLYVFINNKLPGGGFLTRGGANTHTANAQKRTKKKKG